MDDETADSAGDADRCCGGALVCICHYYSDSANYFGYFYEAIGATMQ